MPEAGSEHHYVLPTPGFCTILETCHSHGGKVIREIASVLPQLEPQVGDRDKQNESRGSHEGEPGLEWDGTFWDEGTRSAASRAVSGSERSPPPGSMGAMKRSQVAPPRRALKTSQEALLSGMS